MTASGEGQTSGEPDETLRCIYLDTSVYSWIARSLDTEAALFLRTAAADLGLRVFASHLVVLEVLATSEPRERAHLIDVVLRLADRRLLPDFGSLLALAATSVITDGTDCDAASFTLRSRTADLWERAHDDPTLGLDMDDQVRTAFRRLKLLLSVVLTALRSGEDAREGLGGGTEAELKARLADLRARPVVESAPHAASAIAGTVAALVFYGSMTLDAEPIDAFWSSFGLQAPEDRENAYPDLLGLVMSRPPMMHVVEYIGYHASRKLDGSEWIDSYHVAYGQLVEAILSCDDGMVSYGRDVAPELVENGRVLAERLSRRARELALEHRRGLVRDAADDVQKCLELHCLARRLVFENLIAEAEPTFAEALELARKTDDDHAYSAILSQMSPVYRDLGDLESAEHVLMLALPVVRSIGDRGAHALLLVQLGCLLERRDEEARARALYEDAVALTEGLADPAPLCSALDKIARQKARAGELPSAITTWRDAIGRLDPFAEAELVAAMEVNMAVALSRAGQPRAAYEILQGAIKRLRRNGTARFLAVALADCAASATTPRQRLLALGLIREALSLMISFGAFEDALDVLTTRMQGTNEPDDIVVALQAFYLAVSTESPGGLSAGVRIIVSQAPQGEIFPLLATSLTWIARLADGNPPEPGPLERETLVFMEMSAQLAGVTDQQGFIAWAERNQLRDARLFVPRVREWILSQVPREDWLFDPHTPPLSWQLDGDEAE